MCDGRPVSAIFLHWHRRGAFQIRQGNCPALAEYVVGILASHLSLQRRALHGFRYAVHVIAHGEVLHCYALHNDLQIIGRTFRVLFAILGKPRRTQKCVRDISYAPEPSPEFRRPHCRNKGQYGRVPRRQAALLYLRICNQSPHRVSVSQSNNGIFLATGNANDARTRIFGQLRRHAANCAGSGRNDNRFIRLWATNIHHAEIGCVTCHAEAGEIHSPVPYQRQWGAHLYR